MKNLYIWDCAFPITNDYHSGGAVLVVADSLEDAQRVWEEYCDENFADEDSHYETSRQEAKTALKDSEPDHVFALYSDRIPNQVIVHPDAGCC